MSRSTHAISNVVDVTNYVMLELGQPLHAFDAGRTSGEIVVRLAEPGETLRTLDGVERKLDPDDLLITDDTGPIGLAAVMGGATTEIGSGGDRATTSILLEAAHWEPTGVARTARRHRLPSEAAKRFERGVDPELTVVALARAADLLCEYGGATVAGGVVDLDTRGPRPADCRGVRLHVRGTARRARRARRRREYRDGPLKESLSRADDHPARDVVRSPAILPAACSIASMIEFLAS